jgi:metal-dependent amidase/aminoacylase/carboxypeptidase family protein
MSTLVPVELEQQAIGWRRHLHATPELSFHEVETSRFVEETLRSFDGLKLAWPNPTSVVATLRGGRPGRVLALRADMDALPIQEESDLEFASTRPGVMHACGNAIPHHHPRFTIDEAALRTGIAVFLRTALDYLV